MNSKVLKVNNSYRQILKSSSIIGGAQGISYIIGLIKTKFVASLLGPSGFGLVSLYMSVIELTGSLARLGIDKSGVREVAKSNNSGQGEKLAHTVTALRRACWLTGLLGWLLTAIISYPLSIWMFGSYERMWSVAFVGAALLFTILFEGQSAFLQGTRRVSDLAKVNIISVLIGAILAVSIYARIGEEGIVLVLIATAAVNTVVIWWFARRVSIDTVSQSWAETWEYSKPLLKLGLAFMASAVAGSAAAFIIRSTIAHELGLEANGLYQAAWALSGVCGSLMVSAMSADFYPRLTASVEDSREATRLVNEQIEVGILLSLPGLLAILSFSEWIMTILYSEAFIAGETLLKLFVVSVFMTMISYPMGYILVAKCAAFKYTCITTAFHVLHVGLVFAVIQPFGVIGAAIVNPILGFVYIFGMRALVGAQIGFRMSSGVVLLIIIGFMLFISAYGISYYLPSIWGMVAKAVLVVFTGLYCLSEVAIRVGFSHPIAKLLKRQ
ncbi:oligosaccharide flippase family protein [Methylovulum psychrotolerans]|uniref:Lipid III flippase n=1 Tax=Methylovulum psychrotolerans TaxID=1704499 RepID=A0A2S5CMU2_9GAMM|nr:oligosaccharide flippase family protein [Methylovulum psychrotolerans]POZ52098.1 Lipid III flippase [Methylovulum psychrotolerans]